MLSVIIPTYNEQSTIKTCILNLISFFGDNNLDYEIIVVDDGQDNTVAIVKKLSKRNKKIRLFHYMNRLGKGKAVRIGFKKSKGDLILTYDADASMPPSEIPKLLNAVDKQPCIIIGSRFLPNSKTKESALRFVFSRIFNLLFKLLFFDVKDTQSGYKLINRDALEVILPKLTLNGFDWDIQFLKLANEKGIGIKEVPIVWNHRSESKVNPLSDGMKMFFSLIKLKFS